ncbi:MAG: glycosyltransferase family 9 protein [Desulfobacterales bacterium]
MLGAGGASSRKRFFRPAPAASRREPTPEASTAPAATAAGEPRSILFLRIDRIGDMVLSLPALRALKARFPRARLAVLASPSNQALLRHEPYIDEVLVLRSGRRRLPHLLALLPRLRRRRFSLVLDPLPEEDPAALILALLCGAGRTMGFGGGIRSRLYDTVLPPPPPGRHFCDLTCDLIRSFGGFADPGLPRWVPGGEERDFARRWFADQGITGSEVIGIHPGGSYPSQRWPLRHHAALIRMLEAGALGRVLLLGGEAEAPLTAEIQRQCGRRDLPAFISRDLRQAAAVIARCRLLIANNSGPLHLAAALGVPTVSTRGPTRSGRWTPLGGPHRVLEREGLSCLGCEKGVCPRGTHDCLVGISPAEVFAAVEDLWRATRT